MRAWLLWGGGDGGDAIGIAGGGGGGEAANDADETVIAIFWLELQ